MSDLPAAQPPASRPQAPAQKGLLERFSEQVNRWAASSLAFSLAQGGIILWLLTGPVFHWSDTWQLVVNTTTSVITFLMVFLIHRTQTKDALAIQLKLNELIAAKEGASNNVISVEQLSERELKTLAERYAALARRAQGDAGSAHSIEETAGPPSGVTPPAPSAPPPAGPARRG